MVAFLEENKDTIFRFLTYNKFNIYTPEQVANKYCDESIYVDDHYEFAKITDAWDTPNGVLLELSLIDESNMTTYGRKDYKLLNDIELSKFDIDNRPVFEDEEW